jgi:hypothetical protein
MVSAGSGEFGSIVLAVSRGSSGLNGFCVVYWKRVSGTRGEGVV